MPTASLLPRVRHVVGCMTGTSLDGLDCVLTRITGEGLDMKAEYLGMISRPFDEMLRGMLLKLASGEPATPIEYMRAARMLGVMHADTIAQLLKSQASSPTPDFIVAHGQTIWHAPQDTLSWQLFDPWPIVRHLGVPVCYDLRQADLIAGGQGAPITPIADWVMYRGKADAVVNLGGIANWTNVHAQIDKVFGEDIGPCNLLIDGLCQRLFKEPFDRDGMLSAQGRATGYPMACISEAVDEVKGNRTLGREQFNGAWLDKLVEQLLKNGCSPAEALRGAVEYVGNCVHALTARLTKSTLVLAGGGARNATLAGAIRERNRGKVLLSEDLGIPCEAREAMGFAVLGALSQDGVAITLPQVTGAKEPGIAGAWVYPK